MTRRDGAGGCGRRDGVNWHYLQDCDNGVRRRAGYAVCWFFSYETARASEGCHSMWSRQFLHLGLVSAVGTAGTTLGLIWLALALPFGATGPTALAKITLVGRRWHHRLSGVLVSAGVSRAKLRAGENCPAGERHIRGQLCTRRAAARRPDATSHLRADRASRRAPAVRHAASGGGSHSAGDALCGHCDADGVLAPARSSRSVRSGSLPPA